LAVRRGIVLLGMLLAQLVPGPALSADPPPPNFVVVVFDDLGYADLGAYGSTFIQTPNVDRLAAEGTRFTRFYANAPTCSPSRSALLTGRHPVAVGMRKNVHRSSRRGLPLEVPTLAEILKQAGYATAHFGKWHLGDSRAEDLPSGRGFDRSVVGLNPGFAHDELLVDGESWVPLEGHLTEVTTDRAIEFLEAHTEEPFFLNLWYHTPHESWLPPDRWLDAYPPSSEGAYAAMVSHGDEQLGRLVDRLEALGLDDRTLVLVMSDNGPTEKDLDSPLRGHKGDLYEGGVRVPLVAWWPGRVAAGRVEDGVAAGFDVAPTLAELAQAESIQASFEGRSLAGALLDSASLPVRRLVWERSVGAQPATPEPWNRWAVLDEDWKLVRQDLDRLPELFHVGEDPGELLDLATLHPEVVERLTGVYEAWRRRIAFVSPGLDRIEGDAVVRAPWHEFDGGGVVLRPHSGFRVDDGDFSFRARIWPDQVGGLRTIAEQPGSWVLRIYGSRLQLQVQDRSSTRHFFTTARRLERRLGADVAFASFAAQGYPILVRLYVDGVVEGEFEIDGLAVSDEPVRLGLDSAGLAPFRGTLWSPSFRRLPPLPAELADRDGDGVPDPQDLCIGVANPPASEGGQQADVDADGFGDACDVDFDGDGLVGMTDWLRFAAAHGSSAGEPAYDPVVDVDADGSIGTPELLRVLEGFGARPGPSGVACDGTLLCYAP